MSARLCDRQQFKQCWRDLNHIYRFCNFFGWTRNTYFNISNPSYNGGTNMVVLVSYDFHNQPQLDTSNTWNVFWRLFARVIIFDSRRRVKLTNSSVFVSSKAFAQMRLLKVKTLGRPWLDYAFYQLAIVELLGKRTQFCQGLNDRPKDKQYRVNSYCKCINTPGTIVYW